MASEDQNSGRPFWGNSKSGKTNLEILKWMQSTALAPVLLDPSLAVGPDIVGRVDPDSPKGRKLILILRSVSRFQPINIFK